MSDASETQTGKPARRESPRLDRVLFAGGGTGGHVFMAVAIRDHLSRSATVCREFLFVGTRQGLETRILPPLGFPLETIRIGGLQKVGWRRQLSSLGQLPASFLRSLRILGRFRPRIVIGLGGYSSGPVLAGARLRGIPSVLIEPNVIPGLTNRWLARFCKGAAVAFPETARWFRGDVRVTGIPIRQEFHQIPPLVEHQGDLRLLIFGGSRGSGPINQLMIQALPWLSGIRLSIIHQAGPADCQRVERAYAEAGVRAEVKDFIDDMPHQFACADLILSRAGASTIAEITAAGRPAILIPFPQAADDHQRKNAQALSERGAAILMDQMASGPEDLAATIAALEADRARLVAMASAARSLARPDSTAQIARLMEDIVGGAE